MSSHHIVREKQEPALLVLGLQYFEIELLGQLLEWSPTVIVDEQIAEQLTSLGIKIDFMINDGMVPAEIQSDVKIIPTGNGSAVEAGLKYLIAHGYPAVNIVTDEFLLKDYLFYADKINLVIFCNNRKIYAVNHGFSKWKPKGQNIEVINQSVKVQSQGLEKLAPNHYITTHDGFFTLQFEHPFVFIAESIF